MRKEIMEIEQSIKQTENFYGKWAFLAAECDYWLSDENLSAEEQIFLQKNKEKAEQKILELKVYDREEEMNNLLNEIDELYPPLPHGTAVCLNTH